MRLNELGALGLALLYHSCVTFSLRLRTAAADLLTTLPKLGGRFVVRNSSLHVESQQSTLERRGACTLPFLSLLCTTNQLKSG